jgi:hypothetical protein
MANPQPDSPPENYLLAPNLYVWAYALQDKENLPPEISQHPFWVACDRLLAPLNAQLSDRLKSPTPTRPRILLENEKSISLTFPNRPDSGSEIAGFAQPFAIKDSYGLLFNLGYDDEKTILDPVSSADLRALNLRQYSTLPSPNLCLGETILITAYLSPSSARASWENLQNIVRTCYRDFLAKDIPNHGWFDRLCGSPIFEFNSTDPKAPRLHILILLLENSHALDFLNEHLRSFSDLWLYRNKIVSCFRDSRQTYDRLKETYDQLEHNLDNQQKNLNLPLNRTRDDVELKRLKQDLKTLSQVALPYSRLILKMKDFMKTIDINLHNYRETNQTIRSCLPEPSAELLFLNHFEQVKAPQWRQQIQDDLDYFENGTELINQAIATIRGLVEIDQAERDRQRQKAERDLQDSLQALGVGIAAGAIVASTTGLLTHPWQWPPQLSAPVHPLVVAVCLSSAIALCAWVLTHCILTAHREDLTLAASFRKLLGRNRSEAV